MRAAVLKGPKDLHVMDVPKPAADDEYMIIEVKACGICGSDIRYYNGENPWALHTLGKSIPNPPNIILGHEWGGIVHEVANPAFREWEGRRAAILAFKTCGVCDNCRSGNFNLCQKTLHIGHGAGWGTRDFYPGGMATYCQIWNTHVCEIPDSMSFDEATLLDPLYVASVAINRSGIQPGDDVLVMGTGPVGLCIAQAVRAFGANKVICTDVLDFSLQLADELGADAVVKAGRDSVRDALDSLGLRNVHVVFDTVGTAESQREGLLNLKESGTMVNLVVNNTKICYRLLDLAGERRVTSSANNRTEDFLLGIKLIANGTVNARKMITHTFALEDVQKGFDVMLQKDKQPVMKVVIRP